MKGDIPRRSRRKGSRKVSKGTAEQFNLHYEKQNASEEAPDHID
jgi:hypothetical protein